MFRRSWILPFLLILLALSGLPATAQGDLPQPEKIVLEAADGLELVGAYYAPPAANAPAPAVLLLHMLGSAKEAWEPLIPALNEAGYGVLAVDMRGHGATGGSRDWPLAEQDTQLWLDWLREQPGLDPDRLSIVGASIGANLALRGMANDPGVVTVVALSPGLDYHSVTTEEALITIDERPVFLVASQGDRDSANSVRTLAAQAAGDVQMRVYKGPAHGTNIFALEDDLVPAIVHWLDAHS